MCRIYLVSSDTNRANMHHLPVLPGPELFIRLLGSHAWPCTYPGAGTGTATYGCRQCEPDQAEPEKARAAYAHGVPPCGDRVHAAALGMALGTGVMAMAILDERLAR